MRATIDAEGRLVVPKPLRDELGFAPGAELDAEIVDGRLQVAIRSRVRVEEGPHGIRFAADAEGKRGARWVRELMERGRR
jgi:AbrB family looped-hinge helix DNA binding protein